ncbi:HAD family hydrolase [Parabacteroides bouchesdurhonensis]|uniref:HAD family hydrolase n=1 Tax=Parabacteroides bouchesdurhonensis TaxID=1936995 RepID=UPI000C81D03B|nr:HAD family hydrolase [Parabacteroides bouchesdurhonensis]
MDKKYILMDLDGTLTDPFYGITRSIQYALKHCGIVENDLQKLTPFIGPPLVDSFREIYQFSHQQAVEAIGYYREYFVKQGWSENKVYPGMEDFLKQQRALGRQLYVATSKPEELAIKILEHFGLSRYFEYIGGDTMEHTRTDKAEVIRYVLQYAGITQLEKTIMIGDRKFDINGAHQAGIECIGVLYGYGSREELKNAGADILVDSIEELSRIM